MPFWPRSQQKVYIQESVLTHPATGEGMATLRVRTRRHWSPIYSLRRPASGLFQKQQTKDEEPIPAKESGKTLETDSQSIVSALFLAPIELIDLHSILSGGRVAATNILIELGIHSSFRDESLIGRLGFRRPSRRMPRCRGSLPWPSRSSRLPALLRHPPPRSAISPRPSSVSRVSAWTPPPRRFPNSV